MIIYQLFLRPFSPDGTVKGTLDYIPRIKKLGADVIYLTSCCKADYDPNQEYWSPRHLRSKIDNPKSPYRIMDYYELDEEYGAISDLKELVDTTHEKITTMPTTTTTTAKFSPWGFAVIECE